MSRAAVLAGVGSALPGRDDRPGAAHPAVVAGARALAGCRAGRTGTVVVASTVPGGAPAPGAAEVARELGLAGAAPSGRPAAEGGLLLALADAARLVESGASDRALVVGTGDVPCPADDGSPASRTGAGAFVLRAGDPEEPGALGPFELVGDGDAPPDAAGSVPPGAAPPHPAPRFSLESTRAFWRTVQRMGQAAQAVLDRTGWTAGDVDVLLVLQEHRTMTRRLADELGIPAERRPGAAAGPAGPTAFPLALDHLGATRTLHPGHRVLLAACHVGAGATSGATVLTWPRLDSG
ncbi:3-oxoacyl-[acyl-carrier-protein] synthase III C-terminal domain-containing protein [Streptomyces sp. MAR4 CNX-425]|uniref:3-oxoacyl-[acyl-carrier-protein] synthase III C-terminal domain-containing protein n=1 Tax=Streptomyces sp. MAR4 CNX-425 TaxID=3406343 RepID=UPI003B501425